ncbi:MAG: GNAT family N-acetyltransferase [Eubacteriales bacterium]|nr:GNAT family N-acetyltransferase [Eubacteriales bacterium]
MDYPIDFSTVRLETERLVLRPIELSDVEAIYEYARDERVALKAGFFPSESLDHTLEVVKQFIADPCDFAIEHERRMIGCVSLNKHSDLLYPELRRKVYREAGYVLHPNYWNQGIMTEAFKMMVDYSFRHFPLDLILVSHAIDNLNSSRVIEKSGFKFFKYKQVRYTWRTDLLQFRVHMMTRDDWRQLNPHPKYRVLNTKIETKTLPLGVL